MTNSIQGTILAFDFGLRYIGVAVGQSLTSQARGIKTLNAKQGRPAWHEIGGLIKDYGPVCLVVGQPLHMDGEESDMSLEAQRFAARLKQKFDLPVHLADERLTSFAAEQQLEDALALGRGSNDHEVAACLIAEQFLSGN